MISNKNTESAAESVELSGKMSELSLVIADKRVLTSTAASSIEEIENRIAAIEENEKSRQPILDELENEKNKRQNPSALQLQYSSNPSKHV